MGRRRGITIFIIIIVDIIIAEPGCFPLHRAVSLTFSYRQAPMLPRRAPMPPRRLPMLPRL
jgi:hypothetical protein